MLQVISGKGRGVRGRSATQGCVVSALWLVAAAASAQGGNAEPAGQSSENDPAPAVSVQAPSAPSAQGAGPAVPAAPSAPPAASSAGSPAAPSAQSPAAAGSAAAAPVPSAAPELSSELERSPLLLLPVTEKSQGGLTADEVAARAQRVSPRAEIARADAARAEERADQAVSLFLPRADLKAIYTRLSKVEYPPEFGGFADPPVNSYSLQAIISIPISDYFLSLKDHYDSAQHAEVVARYQRKGELAAVAQEARQAYYELARAVAARNLAEHRVVQLGRFTSEIGVLVDGGELSTVELSQSRAREASAKAALERAVAAQRVAEQALRQQIDLDLGAAVGVGEPLLSQRPVPGAELSPLVESALTKRPEAMALLELVKTRTATRDALSKSRLPSLSLFGNVNYDNPNQRRFPLEEKFLATWSAGAQLTWSPSDFIMKGSDVDDAELEIARVRSELSGLKDRITVEVTRAYENARAAQGAVDAAQTAVVAAQETLDVRLALFHAGEATSREVLDAELDLRVAQLDFIDNVLSTHLALSALEYAIGEPLDAAAR